MNKRIKHFLLIAFVPIITGCANDGMEKPITKELSAKELKATIKQTSDEFMYYRLWRNIGDWISADNMRIAQYGDITYQNLWDYTYNLIDENEIDDMHKSLFPQRDLYRCQADSVLMYLESHQPDSLIKLDFDYKDSKSGFSCYHFIATPLKGKVEQVEYFFSFVPKIDGIKSMDDIPYDHRYSGSRLNPIDKVEKIETYGRLIDYLDSQSTDELKRDYYFIYSIYNIRFNGINWIDVPFEITWYLENGVNKDDAIEMTIRDFIDDSYLPYNEFFINQDNIIRKEKEPNIYQMFYEYYSSQIE